jgi:hypothetical protein
MRKKAGGACKQTVQRLYISKEAWLNRGDFRLRMREKRERGVHVSAGWSRDWIIKTNTKFAKTTRVMKSCSCFFSISTVEMLKKQENDWTLRSQF